MPKIDRNQAGRAATSAIVLVLASLALAACGSSSPTKSTSTSAASTSAASTSTLAPTATGSIPHRVALLRECLKKQGITLPARRPGQRGAPQGFRPGSGLPSGVSRQKYAAAIKTCGGVLGFGHGGPGGLARFTSPAYRAALTKFAACMREHGVNVATPNTSGSGSVFSKRGVDIHSTKFKAAEAKCGSLLNGLIPAPHTRIVPPGASKF